MHTEMPESLIKIANCRVKGGWDTGASISAISKSLFDRLPDSVRSKLENNRISIKVANSSFVQSLGTISLLVAFGGGCNSIIKFQIMENLSRDVIIGNNFMSNNVNIDQVNNYALLANGKKIPFCNRARSPIKSSICVAKDVILKPAVVCRVPCDC
jgi:hypothetical protein